MKHWIITDLKERFGTMETLKGVFFFAAGVPGLWLAIYDLKHAFQFFYALAALYLIYEGLRKIFVNRVKQAVARDRRQAERMVRDASHRNFY